ncbi:MAG: hypothetical protein ACI37T_05405 [Candidatus Gastranaerophilaceae bacterium]
MNNILKVAKRLKTFTLEDIVMFCDIDEAMAIELISKSENIKPVGDKFEYDETTETNDKFKIIDRNIECQNSEITTVEACEIFLNDCRNRKVTKKTLQTYKTFIYAHIIPYFKNLKLKNITVSDIEKFRKTMQNKPVSERRIKNILCLLNQIIKYFQNNGLIPKTCIFEVKRIANIPRRKIQILSKEQFKKLLQIVKKQYPYMLPIISDLNVKKRPLNTILSGSEQDKEIMKRKIRNDFYKIKQQLGLRNFMFDDLRYCKNTF